MGVHAIDAESTHLFKGTITDETSTPIPGSSLTTLTLTLYDRRTGQILAGRDDQNILNANGVTVDAQGKLQWTMSAADSPHVAGDGSVETHVALFRWTFASGTKAGHSEVYFQVRDVPRL